MFSRDDKGKGRQDPGLGENAEKILQRVKRQDIGRQDTGGQVDEPREAERQAVERREVERAIEDSGRKIPARGTKIGINGQILASASADKTIQLWDVASCLTNPSPATRPG